MTAVAFGVLAYFLSGTILRYAVLKYCGAEVSYAKVRLERGGKVAVRDLALSLPEKGHIGFTADSAAFIARLGSSPGGGLEVSFDLEGVRFKRGREKATTPLDALSSLLVVPFEGSWCYSRVRGTIVLEGRTLRIRGLNAQGDDIRLAFDGALLSDATVDGTITIAFSRKAAAQFPEELSSVVLKEEGDGWKSFSVKVEGDYRSPSISLTGKLFRLNITNK